MILIDARCVFLERGEKQVDFCTGKSMDDIVFTRRLVGPERTKGIRAIVRKSETDIHSDTKAQVRGA